jgi:hypothetical protein
VVRDGKLEGIITDTDVFAALTQLARGDSEGKRVCLKIPLDQKFEVFYQVMDHCRELELDLLTILTHPIDEGSAHLVMLRVNGERASEFVDMLWNTKYQVLVVA